MGGGNGLYCRGFYLIFACHQNNDAPPMETGNPITSLPWGYKHSILLGGSIYTISLSARSADKNNEWDENRKRFRMAGSRSPPPKKHKHLSWRQEREKGKKKKKKALGAKTGFQASAEGSIPLVAKFEKTKAESYFHLSPSVIWSCQTRE